MRASAAMSTAFAVVPQHVCFRRVVSESGIVEAMAPGGGVFRSPR